MQLFSSAIFWSVSRVQRLLSGGVGAAADLPVSRSHSLPHVHSCDVWYADTLHLQRRDGQFLHQLILIITFVHVEFESEPPDVQFLAGDRTSEEREAYVGAPREMGRDEICVWRPALSALVQPVHGPASAAPAAVDL